MSMSYAEATKYQWIDGYSTAQGTVYTTLPIAHSGTIQAAGISQAGWQQQSDLFVYSNGIHTLSATDLESAKSILSQQSATNSEHTDRLKRLIIRNREQIKALL